MAIVSRMKLDHPALGTTGGVALHASIETIFKALGDVENSRFFTQDNLANGAYVDFEHNFNTDYDDLRVDLFLRNTGTGQLTEVTDYTGWTIAAHPTTPLTHIRVTNNTGTSKSIALTVLQDPIMLNELVDVDTSTAADKNALVFDDPTKTWKPVNIATRAETLENKTHLRPVIDDYADFNEEASPSTPAAGKVRLFAKADGKFYAKDDSGVEAAIGSGSGTGINVVRNPNDANVTWAIGSPTIPGWYSATSIGSTTNTGADLPLAGIVDTAIKITSATSGQSETYRWQMPVALRNTLHTISWNQLAAAGYVYGDFTVLVYKNASADFTGAWTEVPVNGVTGGVAIGLENEQAFSFMADDAVAYSMQITRAATGASRTLNITNVTIGPRTVPQGAAMTAPVSYTPTSTWTTNATHAGKWSREGAFMVLEIVTTLTGAPDTATYQVSLPSGYTINAAAVAKGSLSLGWTTFGSGVAVDLNNRVYPLTVTSTSTNGTTQIAVFCAETTGDTLSRMQEDNPFTFGAGDYISLTARVPITEWAGSGVVSMMQDETLTEWQTYTPTISPISGYTTSPVGFWRRNGDTMEIMGGFGKNGSAGTGSTLTIAIPSGYTIDTTKLSTALSSVVGVAAMYNVMQASQFDEAIPLRYLSSTTLSFVKPGTNGNITGADIPASSEITWKVSVPILEWKGKSNGAIGFGAASTTQAGLVTTGTQTFAGDKSFGDGTTKTTMTLKGGAQGGGSYGSAAHTLRLEMNNDGSSVWGGIAWLPSGDSLSTEAFGIYGLTTSGVRYLKFTYDLVEVGSCAGSTGAWTLGKPQNSVDQTFYTASMTVIAPTAREAISYYAANNAGQATVVGCAGGNDQIINGSTAGDLVARANNKKILFSTNSGSTIHAQLDTAGHFYTSGAIRPGGSGGMLSSQAPIISAAISSNLTTGNYATLGDANLFGLLLVQGSTSGDVSLIALRGGAGLATVIYTTGTVATSDSGAGEAIYWSGTHYRWKNRSGATRNYQFMMLGNSASL